MLGPNIFRFSVPLTARIESRSFLGLQPAKIEMPEQVVLRIDSARGRPASTGSPAARHLVGIGQHDQPMQRLEMPAVGDQFGGQPIEQFGMGRLVALKAEIAGRANDPAAKVILEMPIGHHAGRHRVVFRGDPVGQHRSPAAGFGARRRPRGSPGRMCVKTERNPGSTFAPGTLALPRISTNVSGACGPGFADAQRHLDVRIRSCSARQFALRASRYCSNRSWPRTFSPFGADQLGGVRPHRSADGRAAPQAVGENRSRSHASPPRSPVACRSRLLLALLKRILVGVSARIGVWSPGRHCDRA